MLRCSSSRIHSLRSAGLVHPQYRFIPLYPANSFPLHSSNIMSVVLYFFSGSPLRLAIGIGTSLRKTSLCPKSRYASGNLIFFPAVSLILLHFASPCSLTAVLGFRRLFDCRNPATALHEK